MTRRLLLALFLSILSVPAFADADLQLYSPLPNQGLGPYVVNSDFSLGVSLYNYGPDTARNVRVTFNVPPELPIRTLSQNCDVTHLPVVCTVGDMAVTQPQQNPLGFNLTFTLPSKSTSLTFGVTVSSDTPDPFPLNTSLSRTFDVVDAAWLVAHNVVSPQRADPGTTTVAKTDVVNFLPSIPQDIHVHYEATNETIESIDAPARWSCSITGGTTADCVAPSLDNNCRCSGTINVTLHLKNDRAGGTATLKTSASNSLPPYSPLPSDATSSTEIYRWIVVRSTADAGDGSLRAAIDEANRGCGKPCKIAFEIPAPVPEAGWFTIAPSTPLPPITSLRVFVDAKTQSAFTGDTNPAGPEIAIDGHDGERVRPREPLGLRRNHRRFFDRQRRRLRHRHDVSPLPELHKRRSAPCGPQLHRRRCCRDGGGAEPARPPHRHCRQCRRGDRRQRHQRQRLQWSVELAQRHRRASQPHRHSCRRQNALAEWSQRHLHWTAGGGGGGS